MNEYLKKKRWDYDIKRKEEILMDNLIKFDSEDLLLEKAENIAILTVGGNGKVNALGIDACLAFEKLLDDVEADDDIGCLIITGSGEKSFIAGADINDLAKYSPSEAYNHIKIGHKLFSRIEKLNIPVIAAINGHCLGGGLEIAMSCDIRLSSSRAKFGQPEMSIGMIPGWGATARLPKLIGMSVAKSMCLTAEMITSEQALNYGLVYKVYETVNEMRDASLQLGRKLAGFPSQTMRTTKFMLNDSFDKSPEEIAERDALGLAYMFTTHDSVEGLKAFLEKRPAVFTGK